MSEQLPYGTAQYYICAVGQTWVQRFGTVCWHADPEKVTQQDIETASVVQLTYEQNNAFRFKSQEQADLMAQRLNGQVWVEYQPNQRTFKKG